CKVTCNSAFLGCEPYYFNHGLQSMPVTLFFDGSIRLLGVMEAMSSDRRITFQGGQGSPGLWDRQPSLRAGGYLTKHSDHMDAVPSFHILTIDGIKGRDTLGAE